MRKKGKIKTAKCFERTHENNADWERCGKGAGRVRWALLPVNHLKDHNFTSDLSKLYKVIQLHDPENERGKRSILFSQHRELRIVFRVTKRSPFDGEVRHPLICEIDRVTGSAWVKYPG